MSPSRWTKRRRRRYCTIWPWLPVRRCCGLSRITSGPGTVQTAVALLAESHISLHEWPEYGFIAFDIFVCGAAEPEPAIELLRARFPEAEVTAQIIDRVSQG